MSQSETSATSLAGQSSRRQFLGKTAIAGIGATAVLAAPPMVHAAGSDVIKIGLVGCGGRGKGAAENAMTADKQVKLVAIGDVFEDKVNDAIEILSKTDVKGQLDVPKDKRFHGFDAYKKVIDSGIDVVLLCTPPHFRPQHLDYAVNANKHVFCEKPVAVDATGVRKVIEICKRATEKKLMMMSGLCYRYDHGKIQLMEKIHSGSVGDIKAIHTCYLTSPPRSPIERKPNASEMEYQLQNWLYFNWISGDHIVEQHIHSLDKARWALGDAVPLRCVSLGGRQVPTPVENCSNYDHFSTVFEFPNDVKVYSSCRQMFNCDTNINDYIIGTKGVASCQDHKIEGEKPWSFGKHNFDDMYTDEHIAFYKALRAGKIIDNSKYMCDSTMMAIMGRMSAYSGKFITWDKATSSKEDWTPGEYGWGNVSIPGVQAIPGKKA
jgi:predicted dehydrogenase